MRPRSAAAKALCLCLRFAPRVATQWAIGDPQSALCQDGGSVQSLCCAPCGVTWQPLGVVPAPAPRSGNAAEALRTHFHASRQLSRFAPTLPLLGDDHASHQIPASRRLSRFAATTALRTKFPTSRRLSRFAATTTHRADDHASRWGDLMLRASPKPPQGGRKKRRPPLTRKPPQSGRKTLRYCEMMVAFLTITGCRGTSSNMPTLPVRTPFISSTTRLPSTTWPNTA